MRAPAGLLLLALAVPPAPGWHRIDLEARKLLMKAEASIGVERCPVSAVAGDLMTPPLGEAAIPTTGMVDVVEVRAEMPFGRSERITVWLDAATGAVLQNVKRRFGKGPQSRGHSSIHVATYEKGTFSFSVGAAGGRPGGAQQPPASGP